MTVNLNLGIIGLSPGNGHPYSWSAIFNGYDPEIMATCPFPSIPEYLAQRRFPDDAIAGANVTHVWTEDPDISAHIAASARISYVVERPEHMIGKVDAVLLARDDADRHFELAKPFLLAGVPIFIDKPLAFDVATAESIYRAASFPGQIFTGSALAYAQEYQMSESDWRSLGQLRCIYATVPKDWRKYSIHAIDPILALTQRYGPISKVFASRWGQTTILDWEWPDGVSTRIVTSGHSGTPFAIELHGELGFRRMVWQDAFSAFRASLTRFVDIVAGRKLAQQPHEVVCAIRLVEAGANFSERHFIV